MAFNASTFKSNLTAAGGGAPRILPHMAGLTPDFTMNATRTLFSDYHRRTFVDAGVAGFKLDECDGNPGDYIA